ncbi:MAG: hypothetical protein IJ065_08805 [Eubacterium sp.]|nr:hypothetical protein [Eubacterium sp.]
MDEFTKVEKLVDITGASYEDVRDALRTCDGDMVDSMVYLEKLGKVRTYKNNNIDPRFRPISAEEIAAAEYKKAMECLTRAERRARAKAEKRAEARARRDAKRGAVGNFFIRILRFLVHNNLVITKDEKQFASIPLLAVLIICNISAGLAAVAIFISMMFGYEYSLSGFASPVSDSDIY